jgi:hypothetical protein
MPEFPQPSSQPDVQDPPLIIRLPDGTWQLTCAGCGDVATADDLGDILDERDIADGALVGDYTAASLVACPDCAASPWRAVYE